jgi:hypothetical protein
MTRIVRWATMAVIMTGLLVTLFVVAQQIERQGADDAPERLASQVAAQLSQGADPADAATTPDVDLATSDAVFVVVYDSADRPVAGTGRLDGTLPHLPKGVLDSARHSGGDRVTWRTPDGRRFATVEIRSGAEVVLGGQSLGPVESRIDRLGWLILVAWAAIVVVMAIGFLVERAVAVASRGSRGGS